MTTETEPQQITLPKVPELSERHPLYEQGYRAEPGEFTMNKQQDGDERGLIIQKQHVWIYRTKQQELKECRKYARRDTDMQLLKHKKTGEPELLIATALDQYELKGFTKQELQTAIDYQRLTAPPKELPGRLELPVLPLHYYEARLGPKQTAIAQEYQNDDYKVEILVSTGEQESAFLLQAYEKKNGKLKRIKNTSFTYFKETNNTIVYQFPGQDNPTELCIMPSRTPGEITRRLLDEGIYYVPDAPTIRQRYFKTKFITTKQLGEILLKIRANPIEKTQTTWGEAWHYENHTIRFTKDGKCFQLMGSLWAEA